MSAEGVAILGSLGQWRGSASRIEHVCFGFDLVLMAIKESKDSLGWRHNFGTTTNVFYVFESGHSVLRQGVVMSCLLLRNTFKFNMFLM